MQNTMPSPRSHFDFLRRRRSQALSPLGLLLPGLVVALLLIPILDLVLGFLGVILLGSVVVAFLVDMLNKEVSFRCSDSTGAGSLEGKKCGCRSLQSSVRP